MTHLSLIASLALVFSGIAVAAPQEALGIGSLHAGAYRGFSPCGAGTHTIDNVFINPDHPETGKQVTITVNAHAPNRVERGSKFDVGFKDPARTYPAVRGIDMCDAARKAYPPTPCPIPAGPYTFAYSVNMPTDYTPDEIEIITKGYYEHEDLFCFQFSASPVQK